jgi:cytochrome P450
MEIVNLRIFRFWLHPKFIYNSTSLPKKQKEAFLKSAAHFTPKIMETVREKMTREDKLRTNKFIYALMDQQNALTDSEIYDEISTIIVAGQGK